MLSELSHKLSLIEHPDDMAFEASEFLGRTLAVSRVGYGTVNKQLETITIERDWNAPGIKSLAGTLHFRDYGSYIDYLKRANSSSLYFNHSEARDWTDEELRLIREVAELTHVAARDSSFRG